MTATAQAKEQMASPWRPVQFLGSKLRSLDFIAAELGALEEAPGRVWEPFTGSSVVAQRLALEGHPLWATDALESSSVFAAALLGVGRDETDDTRGASLSLDPPMSMLGTGT